MCAIFMSLFNVGLIRVLIFCTAIGACNAGFCTEWRFPDILHCHSFPPLKIDNYMYTRHQYNIYRIAGNIGENYICRFGKKNTHVIGGRYLTLAISAI